jgi:hypothetical protein
MSRRISFVVLVLSLALSACLPVLSPISAGDSQATTIALAGTQAAQTLAALPTPIIPPSQTPLPTFTQTAKPSATTAPTETATLTPDITGTSSATATSTLEGSDSGSASSPTATGTVSGTVPFTFTPTPGPLLWGTVPPDVPFGRIKLVNLTNEMVYISFHCTLSNGLTSYLEYPVYAWLNVSIPAGPCHYVAWIKGQQIIGDIQIKKHEEYTFTFKVTARIPKIKITQP